MNESTQFVEDNRLYNKQTGFLVWPWPGPALHSQIFYIDFLF
jgi:hypothetical protein